MCGRIVERNQKLNIYFICQQKVEFFNNNLFSVCSLDGVFVEFEAATVYKNILRNIEISWFRFAFRQNPTQTIACQTTELFSFASKILSNKSISSIKKQRIHRILKT
jgi:hypothetical protein